MCTACANASVCADVTEEIPEAMRAHRNAKERNEELKAALGMPQLRYPTMHHGAAKMFGAGEVPDFSHVDRSPDLVCHSGECMPQL